VYGRGLVGLEIPPRVVLLLGSIRVADDEWIGATYR